MGKFVNALFELKTRLTTAQGTTKKLADIKTIYFGKRPDDYNNIALPAIIVDIDGFQEKTMFCRGVSGSNLNSDIDILITVICSLTEQNAALTGGTVYDFYNLSTGTGIIHYIEKILDVISETTTQAISPNLGLSTEHPVKFESRAIDILGESAIVATIGIKIATALYAFNTRNT